MPLIKSGAEHAILRQAGQKLARVLQVAKEMIKPGLSLNQLDQLIHQAILKQDATPSFLGYDGFPNSACLSLNQQVVHGIPDERILKEGDKLSVDVGLWYKSLCVDAAFSLVLEPANPEIKELIRRTEEALQAGIKAAKPFRRVGAISQAIQKVGEEYGYGIVRTLTGHGVGHQVHEPPEIPNLGRESEGPLLKPGMVLAIEPMFTLGSGEVLTQIDGWGVITVDNCISAHAEHTVIITSRGPEVITQLKPS